MSKYMYGGEETRKQTFFSSSYFIATCLRGFFEGLSDLGILALVLLGSLRFFDSDFNSISESVPNAKVENGLAFAFLIVKSSGNAT